MASLLRPNGISYTTAKKPSQDSGERQNAIPAFARIQWLKSSGVLLRCELIVLRWFVRKQRRIRLGLSWVVLVVDGRLNHRIAVPQGIVALPGLQTTILVALHQVVAQKITLGYESDVIEKAEWPSRLLTTTIFCPSCSIRVARKWRRFRTVRSGFPIRRP